MLRFSIFAALLALAAAPALAQTTLPADGGTEPLSTVPSNVGAGDTKTLWAPQLPVPAVSTDAAPKLFVQAAQARLGLAMLLVSHDLGVVRFMADRVAVLHHGRVVEEAAADTLFAAPQHPYTRQLLAAARG